jgi:translocation and assembly module TamA
MSGSFRGYSMASQAVKGAAVAALFVLFGLTCFAQDLLTVKVEGLEGDVLRNVEAALSPPGDIVREGKVEMVWLELFERGIPKTVAQALEPFGYYQARSSLTRDEGPEGKVAIVVKVIPGEPVLVTSVAVEVRGPGADEEKLRDLVAGFPLREGDVLRQDRYDAAKTEMRTAALDKGYLDADFSVHVIEISLVERTAHIGLTLETGSRYYFGDIHVTGGSLYPQVFLMRYLSFKKGDVFSPRELARTQFNFVNSDRFGGVSVEPKKEEAEDLHVPVYIALTPAKSKRLRLGVSYDTDKGAGFFFRYQDVNFRQTGHEFNAELKVAQRLQGLVTNYVMPGIRDIDSKTTLKLGLQKEITDSYTSESAFFQPEYIHSFGRGRLGSAYLQFRQEDYTVGGEHGNATLIMPGLRFVERRYDDIVHPTKGYRYGIETRGAATSLGSSASFLQFLANGDFLMPLGRGFSVYSRGQAATSLQTDSLENLPPSVRFFTGGDMTVRGYAYESLGPTNALGEVIGGKHLLVGSVEIEKAFSDLWGLAAFYDVGNAFDSFNQIDLKQGAGIGVRIYTPVGPIRLDLARQINVPNPDFRVHFSVGFGL